jgi:hypothetical protein
MKAAEGTSREIEIQQLKEEYHKDFKRELRTMIRICYDYLKATIEYGIAPEKVSGGKVVAALGTLKEFLDIGVVFSTVIGVGVAARPYISATSFGVGKAKGYLEKLALKEGLENRKIFMRIVEKSMSDSKLPGNNEQIEEFADKIYAKLVESKIFERISEESMHRELNLSISVETARAIAGSTLYISNMLFLFEHYKNIQEVAGIC